MGRTMETAKNELAGLRTFLAALEDPNTEYRRGGVDIKAREIEILKREIAYLEAVIARPGRSDAHRSRGEKRPADVGPPVR